MTPPTITGTPPNVTGSFNVTGKVIEVDGSLRGTFYTLNTSLTGLGIAGNSLILCLNFVHDPNNPTVPSSDVHPNYDVLVMLLQGAFSSQLPVTVRGEIVAGDTSGRILGVNFKFP